MPKGVYPRPPRAIQSLHERFEKHAPISGEGCWEWRGPRVKGGYGVIVMQRPVRRAFSAHRLAYEFAFGPIPDGMVACHRCDNPPCVRPDHLWLGTQGDNVRDMFAKGRGDNWIAAARRQAKQQPSGMAARAS